MSKSNASAKNRRAFISPTPNPAINVQPQQSSTATTSNNNQTSGLTLQQVISVIDKRLIYLENYIKDSNNNKSVKFNDDTEEAEPDNHISEILSEFNSRFDIFAEEIGNLKEIVLKLQSFTMDVNKMLLEERNNNLLMMSDSSNQTPVVDNTDVTHTETSTVEDTKTVVDDADIVNSSSIINDAPKSMDLGGSGGLPNYRKRKNLN